MSKPWANHPLTGQERCVAMDFACHIYFMISKYLNRNTTPLCWLSHHCWNDIFDRPMNHQSNRQSLVRHTKQQWGPERKLSDIICSLLCRVRGAGQQHYHSFRLVFQLLVSALWTIRSSRFEIQFIYCKHRLEREDVKITIDVSDRDNLACTHPCIHVTAKIL